MSNEFWIIALVLAFLYLMGQRKKKPVLAAPESASVAPHRKSVHEAMAEISDKLQADYQNNAYGDYGGGY